MVSITLKNIPEKLYSQIKLNARKNRRSINSEILYSLEKLMHSTIIDPDEYLKRLNSFHESLNLPPLTDVFIERARNERRP